MALHFTLDYSTMTLLHSSLLYITLPWFYFTLPFINQPWFYFTVLDSTALYNGSTSLYLTLLLISFDWLEFTYRIPLRWFEFAFECFESRSNASNLVSNGLNPFGMVWICIRMFRIPFRWLEFAFRECFESCLQIGIRIPFKFAFELFESHSNLHSNCSNPIRTCIHESPSLVPRLS